MTARRATPRALPMLLAAVTALSAWTCFSTVFCSGAPSTGSLRSKLVARPGMLDGGMDMKNLENMMKDPKKMEELKKAADQMMGELAKDPAKKKEWEDYQASMQANVAKLKEDPEMKPFFEDIEKNGLAAFDKWQGNENILRKFSQATGGLGQMPGMPGMMQGAQQAMANQAGGIPAAAAGGSFKPGDEVIINGLAKAPELNGKKAMIVPPTSEEKKAMEGTGRMIVRLLDTGDQFAVKPENLRTTVEEADSVLSNSLEDVSVYNPALQTEAAKLRESGKLDDLQEDPELKPIFEDIKKNGMAALEKYWNDEKLMAKISKAMGQAPPKK